MAWQAHWLLAAPHRLAFFAGALMLGLSALWWCAALVGPSLGQDIPWAVMPSAAHALLFSLGFMPLFIVGFLFTAGPKWLLQPEVAARELLLPVLATVMGWLVCMLGFHVSTSLAALGMSLVTLAWVAVCLRFFGMWRRSRASDKAHASVILCASLLGAVAMLVIWLLLLLGSRSAFRRRLA